MKKVGIWIDHRRAVVIAIEDGDESHQVFESDIEGLSTPEGARRNPTTYGPQLTDIEHQVEARNRHHLNRFYKDIIHHIGKPDQLVIIGPAGAKNEFAALIDGEASFRDVPVKVEAADKMTEKQVAAKVRRTEF